MLRKAIGQHLQHPLTGDGIGIDIDFTKLTIGTDIIHTAHVVVVSMRYQNSINLPERLWQNLLTEIRTAVYQQTGLVSLYEDRTTATLVMWVITLTDLTLATDHWYATGCSRSQKRQLHIMFTSGWMSMSNLALTSLRMVSQRATISAPVAPPRFTSTKACLS